MPEFELFEEMMNPEGSLMQALSKSDFGGDDAVGNNTQAIGALDSDMPPPARTGPEGSLMRALAALDFGDDGDFDMPPPPSVRAAVRATRTKADEPKATSRFASAGFGEACRMAAKAGMHVKLHVRIDPDEIPEIDPVLGDVALQAASIDLWRQVWRASVKTGYTAMPTSPVEATIRKWDNGTSAVVDKLENVLLHARWDDMPEVRPSSMHFHEDARRIRAVVDSGLPTVVVSRGGHSTFLNGTHPEKGRSRSTELVLCGRERSDRDRYWKDPVFLRHAGRPFIPCGPDDLHWVAMAFAELGHGKVFLKSTVVKRGTWLVTLPSGGPAADFRKAMRDAVGPEFFDEIQAAAAPGFFVQPDVGFHHEMRFFVMGGKIVQAVPVRRADTALMGHPTLRIEPRSCRAHDGYPSVPDRPRAAAYARAARRIIADLVANDARDTDFVIDMGETGDGRILPIELNSLENAGTYSADPCRVVSAILLRAARKAAAKHEAGAGNDLLHLDDAELRRAAETLGLEDLP